MKLDTNYTGWCNVNYGYSKVWKSWDIAWFLHKQRIYIVFNASANIIYHYTNETLQTLIDAYIYEPDSYNKQGEIYYSKQCNSKNYINKDTQYLFICNLDNIYSGAFDGVGPVL